MSKINDKLGLKAAGARARLNSLSGVRCQVCPHAYVISERVRGVLIWMCGFCGYSWRPTFAQVQAYNDRVRGRDRILV